VCRFDGKTSPTELANGGDGAFVTSYNELFMNDGFDDDNDFERSLDFEYEVYVMSGCRTNNNNNNNNKYHQSFGAGAALQR